MRFWLSMLGLLVMDQLSKYLVMVNFTLGESRPLIDNVLYFTYIHNPGAAFGMLAGKSWFFLLCAAVVVVVMIVYNARYSPAGIAQLAMGLIVGGAIGNFIDRWLYGSVRDFLSLGGWLEWWPVFNIADMGIVCGGIILIIYLILNERNEAC